MKARVRRALILCSGLVTAAGLSGSLLAPWVGPNVRLGEDPAALPAGTGKNQAEPHVIRSPLDPDLVLATFQEGRFSDGGAHSNGFAVSEDGGFSWYRDLNPGLTQLTGGPYVRATDPVGGIGHDGTLFLNSLVSVDTNFTIGELVIQRSEDRGRTWTPPIPIYRGISEGNSIRIFPDKNWMVVNTYPETPTTGRIVVTWTNFRTLVGPNLDIQDYVIMAAYSDDRGATWSSEAFVTPSHSNTFSRLQFQGSQPVFLPGGRLAVVYHRFQGTRLEVAYSPDGGATFPFAPVPLHSGYILYDAPNMRDGTFLPSVSVAAETGDLYVAYTSLDSGIGARSYINFVRSNRPDPGSSPAVTPDWRFSVPLRISGVQPLRSVNTPTIAVSPDGERVTVYFFDNRNDPAAIPAGDFYAVQSVDGGLSWTEPFRITEQTFDLRRATKTDRGYMIGDYFGFAAPQGPGQAGIAVWVDTREASADPWSARIGGLEDSVFSSWLQANLPFATHAAGEAALRYADSDGDGTPNFIEYITGLSPRNPEPIPRPEVGLERLRLASGTDPDIAVTITGWNGRWPTDRRESRVPDQYFPFGEGYWDRVILPLGGSIQQVEFLVNTTERWHLLEESAPVRWVRSYESGWSWSPWFGWLYTASAPWLFHSSLGWLYDANGALYYQALNTYIYPDFLIHPWIYQEDRSFLYVLDDTPWVYETGAGKWIRSY